MYPASCFDLSTFMQISCHKVAPCTKPGVKCQYALWEESSKACRSSGMLAMGIVCA